MTKMKKLTCVIQKMDTNLKLHPCFCLSGTEASCMAETSAGSEENINDYDMMFHRRQKSTALLINVSIISENFYIFI